MPGSPPLPAWLLDKPELHPGLWLYHDAFWELSTERQIGMAEGPIPQSKVDEYADRAGLVNSTDRYRFSTLIKMMDSAYLKHREKTISSRANKIGAGQTDSAGKSRSGGHLTKKPAGMQSRG